jgi:hypothetical protein
MISIEIHHLVFDAVFHEPQSRCDGVRKDLRAFTSHYLQHVKKRKRTCRLPAYVACIENKYVRKDQPLVS